jgi:regulation of enolase protein 1 (concanavalin A-like superfamily)/phosphatidylserine/phosphatidylglycerophosphate/cardiolipin synthase-like enzyme
MTRPHDVRPGVIRVLAAAAVLCVASLAAAQTDQIYFPAVDNVTNALVGKINAETVRIDMTAWYLTEHSVSIALINAKNRGVQVRLIGDRGSIFEIDVKTKSEFYWLASQGLPIRLRYNPTWYPEIDHWKATIFKAQRLVAFGSANYTPNQLAPASSTDYSDETVLFTTDSSLVDAFLTKFDRIWNDTSVEPDSQISEPPYFKNWNDACASESACSDYRTLYPNPAAMTISTARLEPDNPSPPGLTWGQGPEFNDRLSQEIAGETTQIRFVIYRLTVDGITQALLGRQQAGVPVRLIIEPDEYLNRKWPEFWLTHANLDKLWAAGIPIRQRRHNGLTHMKMLVTSNYATNASSNFAAAWQRDNNYFVSASGKPAIYQAMANRFDTMWSDTTGFAPFAPQPPDTPSLASPASGASGVSQSPTLTWNAATFATSYDVYLGTSTGSLALAGNVPAQLVNNPPSTYSWTASSALAGATTYYWRVVARTNATPRDASLVATSSTWTFVTGGTGGGGGGSLPAPWRDADLGSVGVAGSATSSGGTFSVSGAGADIWGTADAFNFAYQSLAGDGQIVARVTNLTNTNAFAKAGVMLREQLTAGAAHVILDVRPGGSVEFMARGATGGSTSYLGGATQAPPAWLRLARSGTTVTASVSSNGSSWTTLGTTTVSMASTIYAGLAVCSHTTGAVATGTFDNVSVTTGGGGGGGGGGALPSPWQQQDVGTTGAAGTGAFASGQFSVQGSGADIWGTADGFHFVYQPLAGDGTVVARVTSLQNTDAYAKAGVMLRDSLASGSPHATLDVRPGGSLEFLARAASGGTTAYVAGATQGPPAWVRLARSGASVTASVSADGSTWTTVGTTTVSMASTVYAGVVVCSHVAGTLATGMFDNVSVSAGGTPPPPPPPSAGNVVIYASDIPVSALHGTWARQADASAAAGVELATPNGGAANTNAPVAAPADYVDVTFNADANTPYRLWLRLRALNNDKFNDSLWVQFSDAQVNGAAAYRTGTTSGLLVNLATDGTGNSVSGWGWQNTAYWLSQATTITFPTSGSHTLRIQVREDGVQFDQIVLSPGAYLSAAPGPVSNDTTIVPK